MVIGSPIIVGTAGGYNVIVTADTGATITLSKSGTTYTAVEDNCTWTFTVADAGSYTVTAIWGTTVVTETLTVDDITLVVPSPVLSNNSPAIIQKVAQAGTGDTYWDIGDMTATITFQSSPYPLSAIIEMDGLSCCAFIIGFDHNSSKEGAGIHFQIGKTSTGTSICYSAQYSMRMQSANSNSGGWAQSDMRSYYCSCFFDTLPEEWKAVIAPCPKYTDNVGEGTNAEYCVTVTQDSIWLLSEFEVFGTRTYANTYERYSQAQYQYYSQGNSKVKYSHSATSTATTWWLRSPDYSGSTNYCVVNTYGNVTRYSASSNYGLVPCFKVA